MSFDCIWHMWFREKPAVTLGAALRKYTVARIRGEKHENPCESATQCCFEPEGKYCLSGALTCLQHLRAMASALESKASGEPHRNCAI